MTNHGIASAGARATRQANDTDDMDAHEGTETAGPVVTVATSQRSTDTAQQASSPHADQTTRESRPRTRAAQKRLDEIVLAAVDVINERGYNGMSLQAVANKVGITQAGVLHYVGNKEGLLFEVIRHYYDRTSTTDDYFSLFEPDGPCAGRKPTIPEFCRAIVAENARQPELVTLFHMLNTESIPASHPAHEYFVNRTRSLIMPTQQRPWYVPDGIDADQTLSVAMAAMYGLEGRWLAARDVIDYEKAWTRYEDVLFPRPTWEGYR